MIPIAVLTAISLNTQPLAVATVVTVVLANAYGAFDLVVGPADRRGATCGGDFPSCSKRCRPVKPAEASQQRQRP